ncbi:MAG: outer membrane protein transport protein [Pseudomonadota bacterium]
MRLTRKNMLLPSILVGLLGLSQVANAAISQQFNQDAAGLGDSQAGSAASALDASTEFYNPAGLLLMNEQQVIFGDNLSMPSYKFSRTIQHGGTEVNGESDGGVFAQSPYLHYAAPISEKWAFGFGVSSPFAAHGDWSSDTQLHDINHRYYSTNSDFSTYDISTDLAYAITKKLSVGAGFDFVRVIFSENDTHTQNSDSYDTSLSGSQWDKGWHGGLMYQFTPATRVGLAYHSKVSYEASGTASTEADGAVLQSTNDFVLSSTLPAYTTASVYTELNSNWAVEGSVNYTQWSNADEVTYQNLPTDTEVVAQATTNYELQNTWRTSLGAHYTVSPEIMLRAGLGYETSPYKNDATNIYLAAPEGSTYDISAGLQYKYSHTLAFDFGWTHLFYVTQDIATSTTTGEFSGSNDILGAQVRWDML